MYNNNVKVKKTKRNEQNKMKGKEIMSEKITKTKVNKPKTITYNEKDYAIVNALKGANTPLTRKEIGELAGMDIAAGTLTSCVNKGLIAVAGKKEVLRPVPRKVNGYVYITDEVMKDAKGKEKTYTEMETKIIAALKEANKPLSLTDIATALGLEKIAAGSVSGIKKSGNIGTTPEKLTVIGYNPDEVNVYVFVADIPEPAFGTAVETAAN